MMGKPLPILHIDRRLEEQDVAYVGDWAKLVGSTDAELAGAPAAIIGIGHFWDADRFAQFPDLRVISRMGIGYDNIDLAAARSAGVVVCNGPDSPTVSTAEHTIALMLAVTKELPAHQSRAVSGVGGPAVATALELDGSTLGLVGLGRIGSRVAKAALALGMRVIAHDPGIEGSAIDGVQLVGLDEVLRSAHVISLHAPSVAATRHMINADSIAMMRRRAYIINCARGPLIDHNALGDALDSGHIAGAGLDVTEPEPLPVGHQLLARPNVIVTPHVASSTTAGRRRLFEHAVDNAVAVLDGRPASIVS
jgi:phosphoglycerate dehydrogenase-like enzyme